MTPFIDTGILLVAGMLAMCGIAIIIRYKLGLKKKSEKQDETKHKETK